MTPSFTLRPMAGTDEQAILDLEMAYAQVYPGAVMVPPALYGSPYFHGGQDVFCAWDADGRLLAYAPILLQSVQAGPAEMPHIAWSEIKAHPEVADPSPVKDALYDAVIVRAGELAAEAEASMPSRPVRLTFEYRANEGAAVAFVLSKGLAYQESIFHMARDLNQPILDAPAPEGIQVRAWKMTTEDEQRAYVAARNACFPEAPTTLASWQYFMQSPQWAAGTAMGAFAGDALVGNVSVYWDEDEIRQAGKRFGYTEDIFVLADWRGRGVASAMLSAGMRYLKAHAMQEARLAVRALNENALGLYLRLGYCLIEESRFYTKII